jgi:2-methylcitrate dehydratase PrpD
MERIPRRTLAVVDTSRRVWGADERLSAPHAALANGTAVQGFEI